MIVTIFPDSQNNFRGRIKAGESYEFEDGMYVLEAKGDNYRSKESEYYSLRNNPVELYFKASTRIIHLESLKKQKNEAPEISEDTIIAIVLHKEPMCMRGKLY